MDERQQEDRQLIKVEFLEEADQEKTWDIVIIGAGPAGAAAALYAARARMSTLVIDKSPGSGALAISEKIANYPGVEGEIPGRELLDAMHRQAASFGAVFVQAVAQGLQPQGLVKEVYTNKGVYRARSVIIAVGARGRSRKIPGEEEFTGRGVSYCATCDAAFYRDKVVAVVGDSEEALHEATFLTRFARLVHLVVPGSRLLGVEGVTDAPPNMEIHWKTKADAVVGDAMAEGLAVTGPDGKQRVIPVDGVFMYLSGGRPGTDFLMGLVPVDDDGYVLVDHHMATSVEGVYAAGDCRRPPMKQVVTAAADGALAALMADRHIHARKNIVSQR